MNKPSFLVAALLAGIALTAQAAPGEDALRKGSCLACHAKDKKVVGPSFKDIAARYKGQDDALAKLSQQVRQGSAGVWGPLRMPPSSPARINDAALKLAIEAILQY